MNSDPPRRRLIAALEDVPAGGLGFTYGAGPLALAGILVRTEVGARGWLNRCRHLAVPLDHQDPGRFASPRRGHLVCSVHGALYRADDGTCVAGPCRGAALRPLPVVVDGGRAYLDLDALAGPFAIPGHDP